LAFEMEHELLSGLGAPPNLCGDQRLLRPSQASSAREGLDTVVLVLSASSCEGSPNHE
jgi:hypothetical protein